MVRQSRHGFQQRHRLQHRGFPSGDLTSAPIYIPFDLPYELRFQFLLAQSPVGSIGTGWRCRLPIYPPTESMETVWQVTDHSKAAGWQAFQWTFRHMLIRSSAFDFISMPWMISIIPALAGWWMIFPFNHPPHPPPASRIPTTAVKPPLPSAWGRR